MGGWAPRTIDVALPVKLSKLAGDVKIVSCRYLGGGQLERIATARAVRAMERMERAGEAFMKIVSDRESPTAGPVDPLAENPPDLVCRYVVRALDGEPLSDVADWIDETHPDVLKFVALGVLTASGLIPEAETDRGEDSGGSSAA